MLVAILHTPTRINHHCRCRLKAYRRMLCVPLATRGALFINDHRPVSLSGSLSRLADIVCQTAYRIITIQAIERAVDHHLLNSSIVLQALHKLLISQVSLNLDLEVPFAQ